MNFMKQVEREAKRNKVIKIMKENKVYKLLVKEDKFLNKLIKEVR